MDVRLGYKQASENIEIFDVKLKWSKSAQLLEREVFVVSYKQASFYLQQKENLVKYLNVPKNHDHGCS